MAAGKKRAKEPSSELTDNKRMNVYLLSFDVFFFAAYILLSGSGLSGLFRSRSAGSEALYLHALCYVAAYLFASYWFSPDLDIRVNRPGKGTFPFGPVLKMSASFVKSRVFPFNLVGSLVMTILGPLHAVFNRLWYWLWQPFAFMFTHRGAIHIPFFGTLVRIAYLSSAIYLFYSIAVFVGARMGMGWHHLGFSQWNQMVIKLSKSGGLLTTALVAVTVSDLKHIAVDWYDTLKKGTKFVPPPAIAPRGFFASVLASLIGGRK